MRDLRIVIKGAGEMATGIACRLFGANLRHVLMLEAPRPLTIRRTVSFSRAVYEGGAEVEGIKAVLIRDPKELARLWQLKQVGVMVDPEWRATGEVKPGVVIDAVMAKRNLGTVIGEAPLVIGIGPGFTAPEDVHVVIESNRGHNLGRAIYKGAAEPHTGIPGDIMGFSVERVLRSPHAGKIRHVRQLGDTVAKGDIVLYVDEIPVRAKIDGLLRGLIREMDVKADEKIADVDPRGVKEYCHTVTDKARAIGGGVLEAIMNRYSEETETDGKSGSERCRNN
jgi:xanthine dehydrogenase accessory factor